MRIHYLRRYRMEFDFARSPLPLAVLPEGYAFASWCEAGIDRHASVKFASFHSEIDSHVFPSLSDAHGCRRLMSDISGHDRFLPEATWLIQFRGDDYYQLQPRDCATIQGIVKPRQAGSIQNVGVTPEHRGRGLGRALLLQSLHGFRQASMRRVYLDVTADNERAVELYRSIGFIKLRTMYQAVDFEPEVIARPLSLPRDHRHALAELV